jgi:hypothetical protein
MSSWLWIVIALYTITRDYAPKVRRADSLNELNVRRHSTHVKGMRTTSELAGLI